MTIEEIQSNEKLRQTEFPVARSKAYFAHAGVCALPRKVSEAAARYASACTAGDQETVLPAGWFGETRALAAKLIGALPEEIALLGPTSLGLSFVAAGLKFRRSDHVLIYHDDYPSNVYPWMALAERGVQIRELNLRQLGQIRPRDVFGQVDENTRLVALASCHFLSGWRIALEEIGAWLRERGVLFCVDAIQTIGAFPTPAHSADFMAADSHKWMLGPCGAGIFYVRKEAQAKLPPVVQGWHNLRCPDFVSQDDLVYKPDARRYEAGTHNILGLVGMRAGLELLLEIGIENISRDLVRKRAWVTAALEKKGCRFIAPEPPGESRGGMFCFAPPAGAAAETHARLLERGIVTSLRADRQGVHWIRVSPHFYNTDAELQRLVEAV